MPADRLRTGDVILAVTWVVTFAALQWSVPRYRIAIVLVLVAATLLLGTWLVRRASVALTPGTVVAILLGATACAAVVPQFSYLPQGASVAARVALAGAALVAAVCFGWGRWRAGALTAVAGYVAVAATAILSDPSPRIDVWVTLQQASDGLARGENIYAMTWSGSPGIRDAFTYLPWSAVLLAPGRWIAGDVRWMLTAWVLVLALGIWRLGGVNPGRSPGPTGWTARLHGPAAAAGILAVLLLVPGTLTQVDQAWTEPLLLTGLVWWAVLVASGRPWWAVVPLALACASKQHLVLLLPLLLVWRPFGWRRTIATGALAAALVLPWFVASPADFVHDTVTLLMGFHAIRFADTVYLLALNTFGVALPFWVTGLAVGATLVAATVAVRRRQPGLAEVLRWCAFLLAVANLVNKQAFYNQYWLVAALVLVSLAVPLGGGGASGLPGGTGTAQESPDHAVEPSGPGSAVREVLEPGQP